MKNKDNIYLKRIIYVFIVVIITYFVNYFFFKDNEIINIVANILIYILTCIFILILYNLIVSYAFHDNPKKTIHIRIKTLIILTDVIFILIFIQPSFIRKLFYIHQISLFIFMTLLIIYLGILIYRHMLKKNLKRKKIIMSWIVNAVVILLTVVANLQVYYIKNYLVPPLYGCTYYDNYKNNIYNSYKYGSCPKLNDISFISTDTGSELSFNVHEIYDTGSEYRKYINYKYDINNRVTHYNLRNDQRTTDGYRTYTNFSVENTYEDNKFTSKQTRQNDNINEEITYISELIELEGLYRINISIIRHGKQDNLYSIIFQPSTQNNYSINNVYKYHDHDVAEKAVFWIDTKLHWTASKSFTNPSINYTYDLKTRYLELVSVPGFRDYFTININKENDNIFSIKSPDPFYNFTINREETNFGFVFKYYHLQKQDNGKYHYLKANNLEKYNNYRIFNPVN